jgi:hypothetical protein
MIVCTFVLAARAADPTPASQRIPTPPLMNGGLAGLWANDHVYMEETYGEFDLLNLENSTYRIKRDSITDKTWVLFAMGDFLPKQGLQYATLGKLKNKPDGTLLCMFEWSNPDDSTGHGVIYHTFLGRNDLLLRTKQGEGGKNDTLELSCADLQRVCGKCYFDRDKEAMTLEMTNE